MIDLYTFTTPNGRKVSVALEEMELPYTPHVVHIGRGEQHRPEFLAINPNGKIPAIIDRAGTGGGPVTVFESGAILIYLAEKTGRFLAPRGNARYAALEWLMFQMGGVGPMFGQLGFFLRASEKIPMAIERYTNESKRLLGVMEARLADAPFLAGEEYTIADMATYPWLAGVRAMNAPLFEGLAHVPRWLDQVGARPAVQRGMAVPTLPPT